jgi:hypothetical protein
MQQFGSDRGESGHSWRAFEASRLTLNGHEGSLRIDVPYDAKPLIDLTLPRFSVDRIANGG